MTLNTGYFFVNNLQSKYDSKVNQIVVKDLLFTKIVVVPRI